MQIGQHKRTTFAGLPTLVFIVAGAVIITICPLLGLADQGSFPAARFVGIHEPSGIEHNGSVTLIIEDEKKQSLHVLSTIKPDGSPVTSWLDCGVSLDDSEGIASDGNFFYIVGSHHTKDDGTRRKKREFLARLNVSERTCSAARTSPSLYEAIQHVLRQAGLYQKPVLINIEAMAWQHGTSYLYVALREPLLGNEAILLTLLNPKALFENNESPRFSETIMQLPLGGGGIRAMAYIPGLDGYLIANESRSGKGKMRSRLWYWKGKSHTPEPIKLPGFKKLENVEGLTAHARESQEYVLFVSDDGNKSKNKGAHFALVPTASIKSAMNR